MAAHVDLKAVEEFLRNKTYPKGILKDKGKSMQKLQHCQCAKKNKELCLKYKEQQ